MWSCHSSSGYLSIFAHDNLLKMDTSEAAAEPLTHGPRMQEYSGSSLVRHHLIPHNHMLA